MSRYAEMYKNDVAPALMKKFNYKSPMQIPKFDKIVVNVGAGDAKENSKVIDKLFNLALPRVRDFKGINPNAFDGRGNYALGLKEQLIFPEIEYDKVEKVRGMDIIFVTTANTDEEARELLTLMGAPFAK